MFLINTIGNNGDRWFRNNFTDKNNAPFPIGTVMMLYIKPEIDLRNLKNNTVSGWVLVAVDARVRTERESAL